MFNGYTDGTYEFFMALRFNNNTEFFHSNHEWYMNDVRRPCTELAAALSDTIESIDPLLERRPNRVVSRINRDIRFSNDKTPYRDHIWLGFQPPHGPREETMSFYFEISARDGAGCGMGFYRSNRPLMRALRHKILLDPAPLLEALLPTAGHFVLYTDPYKRMVVPAEIPEPLRPFYTAKGFYLEHHFDDEALVKSPALADAIKDCFLRLKPLYRYLRALTPIPEEDTTRTTEKKEGIYEFR